MNYFKTAILLAALTALFMLVGYVFAGYRGMAIALVFASIMNVLSYWFSDKIVLKMYGAKPVDDGYIYDIVKEMAQNAEIPMPKVYIMESPQANAFATGRNPENAAVAVTSGITNLLDRDELRAVVAHEIAHIKNHDTLTMTLTATIAGALGMLANMAMFSGNKENRGGTFAIITVVIFAPLAAMLVQMAISRTREYSADRDGALISGSPDALASALKKITEASKYTDYRKAEENPATAHLFIINPLHGGSMDNLFSTHPSTENRIEALSKIAQELGSTEKRPQASTRKNQNSGPWSS